MRGIVFALGLILVWAASAAAFEIEEERIFDGGPRVLRIISTTDTAIFAPFIAAFQAREPDVTVHYTVASSQETYRALAEDGAAFDLAMSSAMDLQMKLANDGFALAHRTSATEALPDWARWRGQLFAFAQEPVVAIVSLRGLDGLEVPRTRADLIRLMRENPDRFRGRVGTYDPQRSGAGYLFATQDARQSDTYWRLAEVMGGLEPRLYGTSSGMISDIESGGLVVAYNVVGSYAMDRLKGQHDGQILELEDFTHVLLRTALIPATAADAGLGAQFLDFLLSEEGQSLIESETGLPRINEAALAAGPHLRPIRLDPGLLVYVDPLKRQRFLREWAAAVVRQ
jgi:iron(III) transport system substrate-binding protein